MAPSTQQGRKEPLLDPVGSNSHVSPTALQTLAGVMGNVLEWYDFALFGFFSDVIAQIFFAPMNDDGNNDGAMDYGADELRFDNRDTSNLVRSFSVFGAAFLTRPLGGLVIGYIGDKHGRKDALVLSLFLMAFPTFLMGCLPTYDQVGSWSTVALMGCRLLQGVSVGGQLPASLIYTVESKDKRWWGFYGSLVMMASNVGTLIGNLVGALLRTLLTDDQLLEWGWRIPFLSGILIAFVATYLRLYGEDYNPNILMCQHGDVEDEEDDNDMKAGDGQKEEKNGQLLPQEEEYHHHWREVFQRENLPALGSATFTPMLWGAGFYTTFVWMAIFMEVLVEPPVAHAFWINAMALLFGLILPLPIAGLLSDYLGRHRVMSFGAIGLAILGPIMVPVIASGKEHHALFAQITLGIFLALFGAPMNAWLVEKFPPRIRLTSAALGYDLASCTASAFSPLVATVLLQDFGPKGPGAIYPVFALLAFMGMFMSTKIHSDDEQICDGFQLTSMEDGHEKKTKTVI